MIDLRLYRYALLAVPLVAVIAMFSLAEPVRRPSPAGSSRTPSIPTSAAPLAKQLGARPPPTRRPARRRTTRWRTQVEEPVLGDRRRDRLRAALQRFVQGHDVHLRNLIATLPGESNRQIALIAPRDVAEGSGAVTSAASTAADAGDREQLLGLRPSQDPRLRLHRRIEHRCRWAPSDSFATTATPGCSTQRSC